MGFVDDITKAQLQHDVEKTLDKIKCQKTFGMDEECKTCVSYEDCKRISENLDKQHLDCCRSAADVAYIEQLSSAEEELKPFPIIGKMAGDALRKLQSSKTYTITKDIDISHLYYAVNHAIDTAISLTEIKAELYLFDLLDIRDVLRELKGNET